MKRIVLLSVLATAWHLAPTHAHADERELWLEAGAEIELHDRVDLDLKQKLRFDRDVSRVQAVIPEAELSFEAVELYTVGVGYRYEYERRDGELEGGHRVHLDNDFTYDISWIRLGYRLRLQDALDREGQERLRNRIGTEVRRWDDWTPFLDAELFHERDDGEIQLQKSRFTLGLELEHWEQEMQGFYRLEVPKDRMDPIVHIVGLELKTEI